MILRKIHLYIFGGRWTLDDVPLRLTKLILFFLIEHLGMNPLQMEVLEDHRDLQAESKFNEIANRKFTMQKVIHYIKPK